MFLVALQTFGFDACLTTRTILPADFRALVTTNMEVFTRKERYHLVDYIFKKLKHVFLARTHHDVFHTPDNTWRTRLALTRKFRISSDSSHLVSRQLQLRNHCDKMVGRIFNHLLNFFLRIITAMLETFTLDTLSGNFL